MKHRWGAPVRPDIHHTERRCERCGLIRLTRHEPDARPQHWIEWRRDGARIAAARTPACEASNHG